MITHDPGLAILKRFEREQIVSGQTHSVAQSVFHRAFLPIFPIIQSETRQNVFNPGIIAQSFGCEGVPER